jgi:[ribosomal protein S5]-alanine N-acetyltransferase
MKHREDIKTERLYLQELQSDDQEALIHLIQDHEVQAIYYEGVESLKKIRDDFEAYLKSGKSIWTIRPISEETKIIGICSIGHWDQLNRTFEIEGALLPLYWNNGIMHEALSALMQYVESRVRVNAFVCSMSIFNKRAIALANRLGFHKLGSLDHEHIFGRTASIRTHQNVKDSLLHA